MTGVSNMTIKMKWTGLQEKQAKKKRLPSRKLKAWLVTLLGVQPRTVMTVPLSCLQTREDS
jgi:hypothetical protein